MLSMLSTEAAMLPPASQAVDLVDQHADLFLEQPGAEQRKLPRLLLEEASWKGGRVADVLPGAV